MLNFLLTPDIDFFASRINTTTDKYFLRPWSPGNRLQPLFPSLAMYCICFPPLLWRWANFYFIILQIHYQMKYQFPHLAHSTIFSRPAWCFISKNVFFQLCYQKGQPSFPDMQGNFWHVLFLQGQKLWKIFWNRRSHALNTDTSNTLLIGSLFRKLCISKVDINYIGMFLIFMFEEVLSVLLLIICAMLSLFLLEIN